MEENSKRSRAAALTEPEQAPAKQTAPEQAGQEPEAKQPAGQPAAAPEQTEQEPSFQSLIREKYREDYLQALSRALSAQAREAGRYLAYRELCFAAERVKQSHPEFELTKALEDPVFARLIENGVDPGTAYEVVRREETERLEAARARNAERPQENGLGRGAATASHPDPRALTPAERRLLRRRAARGEQIVW